MLQIRQLPDCHMLRAYEYEYKHEYEYGKEKITTEIKHSLELSVSSVKVTWKECPLFRMSMEVDGSYVRDSGFRPASNFAAAGTMSMGDWRTPSAFGKSLDHVAGP